LSPQDVEALADFFDTLVKSGAEEFFHPHPFTRREAESKCNYAGKDLYYVLAGGKRIVGYGMLRGWDEGHEIPSLGIAIHPDFRGRGYGRLLMGNLHAAARWRGARVIRLKVERGNDPARKLYETLGYHFDVERNNEFVGLCDLVKQCEAPRS